MVRLAARHFPPKEVRWVRFPYHPRNKSRSRAEVARWAHNPKVGGSIPPSATNLNLVMRKLLLLFLLTLSSFTYSQKTEEYTDVPFEMYGVWRSVENEFLRISSDVNGNTRFQRVEGRKLLASGEIKRVGNELHIIRSDSKEEYDLMFMIRNGFMVITKPNSDRAWLWEKVQ